MAKKLGFQENSIGNRKNKIHLLNIKDGGKNI
jgi:hypothetical protein